MNNVILFSHLLLIHIPLLFRRRILSRSIYSANLIDVMEYPLQDPERLIDHGQTLKPVNGGSPACRNVTKAFPYAKILLELTAIPPEMGHSE